MSTDHYEKKEFKTQRGSEARKIKEVCWIECIHEGTCHDGRIECIAGNGIMSELGVDAQAFSI